MVPNKLSEFNIYRCFSFLLLCLLAFSAEAQILKPASWSTKASEKAVSIGEEIDLIFLVDIQNDWYLYSTDFDPDLGPMVTEFTFLPNESYELVGNIKPIGSKEKYDEIWNGNYTYFTEKAEFRQTIKVLEKDLVVKGSYAYQVCTDVDGKCIPFEDEFEFSGFVFESTAEVREEPIAKEEEKVITNSVTEENVKVDTSLLKNNDTDSTFTANLTEEKEAEEEETSQLAPEKDQPSLTNRSSNDPYSLLGFMLIAFLGGLAALLTPCVFPMIPMTVTFFTTTSKNRKRAITKAFVYGFSILIIYVLAGTVVAVINGPDFANWLSTHWLPNIFFFLIFLFFALSFLGLFEITLPGSLVNKIDRESDKGGYYGVFFMAFTLVLVSFSCTGPIVGSILVEAAGGQIIKPVLGMFAFALAFAIPFTLFAVFPEWLNNLPKSGGWLNSVKVSLGFLELAFSLKFLSIADQVYHWNLLDREIYLVLWIVIFFFWGLYLIGKIKLPHDSELNTISVPRLILAIVVFSFSIYLVPGLFGAPLKSLAGYLPPMNSHDFDIPALVREQNNSSESSSNGLCDTPKYSEDLHLPHGLSGYFNYDQALACARVQNKPLFIDFTGHGCVNCREMEASVWSDPAVLSRLRNDYVIVALYVDEKIELPEKDWYESSYDGKLKTSIGKQNADLQITRFENNAQPFYVLLDNNEELLTPPVSYDLDVSNFVEFLDKGIANFEKRNKP